MATGDTISTGSETRGKLVGVISFPKAPARPDGAVFSVQEHVRSFIRELDDRFTEEALSGALRDLPVNRREFHKSSPQLASRRSPVLECGSVVPFRLPANVPPVKELFYLLLGDMEPLDAALKSGEHLRDEGNYIERVALLRCLWRLGELKSGHRYVVPADVAGKICSRFGIQTIGELPGDALLPAIRIVVLLIHDEQSARGMPRSVNDIVVACEEFGRIVGGGQLGCERGEKFLQHILRIADVDALCNMKWNDLQAVGEYVERVMRLAKAYRLQREDLLARAALSSIRAPDLKSIGRRGRRPGWRTMVRRMQDAMSS
ncbi:hypothetical protein ABU614_19805 [Lysobacter firmicutimachus]|uniref:Uncharacterized protein n=1 Tax=Lysobacter firmicutimachus TaxID=1792846 RepID=A0AAU8MSD6_9GAMM